MTSPNVGKVVLGVGIDPSQLTKDVLAAVLPQLDKLRGHVEKARREMDKVNADPFTEVAAQARQAANDMGKLSKAQETLTRKTADLSNQRELLRNRTTRLKLAQREYNQEVREEGSASEATALKVAEAERLKQVSIEGTRRARVEVQRAKAKIADEEIGVEEHVADAIEEARARAMEAINEHLDVHRKAVNDMIKDGKRESDEAIRNERAKMAARDELRKRWLSAEKKHTNDLKRESDKRERDAKRAADKATRAALRAANTESFIDTIKNAGRTVGAVSHLVGPAVILQVVKALTELTTVASAASQSLLALPAGFAAAGAAAGTLELALFGVDDAFQALLSNDPKKFAEALDQLSPSAQRAFQSLSAGMPVLKEVQQATQDAFFTPFEGNIDALISTYQPAIKQLTTSIAGSIGGAINDVLGELNFSGEAQQNVALFIDNVSRAFKTLEPAITPVTQALLTLIGTGSNALPRLADVIADVALRVSALIQQLDDTGELDRMINVGIDALIVFEGWIEKAVAAWFQLAPVGERLLPEIDNAISSIIEVLPDIAIFIAQAGDTTAAWADILKTLEPIFALLNTQVGQLGTSLVTYFLNPLNIIIDALKAAAALWNLLPFSDIQSVAGQPVFGQPGSDGGFLGRIFGGNTTLRPGDKVPSGTKLPPGYSVSADGRLVGPGGMTTPGLPPGIGLPGQIPNLPWDQLSPVDRWLAADAAAHPGQRGPNAGLPPGVRRTAKGGIVFSPGPSNPLYEPPQGPDEPSAGDLKKQIESSLNPADFQVDPWAFIGAPNVNNGSMQVQVTNLPKMPGFGAPGGFPGFPSLPGGTASSSNSVAQAILQRAFAEGYNNDQALAILSTAIQESGLDPNIVSKNGLWKGVFQQDSSYPGRDTMQGQLDGFFERLRAHGGNTGDIWKNIFWLQQRPGDQSADSAYAGGRQSYLSEIMAPLKDGRVTKLLTDAGAGGAPSIMPGPISGLPDPHGANIQVSYLAALAESLGLQLTSGKDDHVDDGLNHPKGLAGDFAIPGVNVPDERKRAFAQILNDNFGDLLNELIYSDPQFSGGISMGKPHQFDAGTLSEHMNHVHASVSDANAPAFIQRLTAMMSGQIPTGFNDSLFAQNGPLTMDPLTGQQGYFQVDSQKLQEAAQAVEAAGRDVSKAAYDLAVAEELRRKNAISEQDLLEAQWKKQEADEKLQKEQADYLEAQRGDFKKQDAMDYSKLPFGDPRKVLAAAIGGAGGSDEDISAIVGSIFGSAAGPIGQFAGDTATNALLGVSPQFGPKAPGVLRLGTPTGPGVSNATLLQQGNPLAFAQMAGFNVPDYTRQGGDPSAQNPTLNGGPPNDAMGRIYSDTAALIDRTFTNLDAAEKARFDQTMAVLTDIKDRLAEQAVGPIIQEAVTSALQGAGEELGTAIGNAAGPIIASAVASAIPSDSGSSGGAGGQIVNNGWNAIMGAGSVVGGGFGFMALPGQGEYMGVPTGVGIGNPIGALYDEGGLWPSGTFGTNLSGMPERVLDPASTKLFDAGLLGGWNLQPLQQHMATTGGVIVNDTVGAEFFGVSQIPIIGAIVNLLVQVLLKIIGVEIEARDTLNEMSDNFRDFRGDFQRFDAAGRLMNDTSGLVDRSSTSEQTAADERIRILKIVLQALIKYIVEKLIVPIAKAVGQSLLSAASGAASGAIGASFPGGSIVGNAVGGIINSAGSAAIDIIADVGTDFGLAFSEVALQGIFEGLQSYMPGIMGDIFGGGLIENLLAAPLTGIFDAFLAPIGGIFSSLLGGLALPFDSGGIASGTGWMRKATIEPERVLNPSNTVSFDMLPGAIQALVRELRSNGGGNRTVDVGGITLIGSQATPENVGDHLLDLL